MVLRPGLALGILLDAAPLDLLDLLDQGQVNAVLVVDIAVGVGHGHHLAAQLGGLLAGVDGHVARAGDNHGGALKALAAVLEQTVGQVAQAVAGGLLPGQGAAVGQALAGEHAGEFVAQPFVLAEQVADLPGAHPDVAGGHVGVGADILEQLVHKGLAEAHDLGVRLALGIEVGAALAAADGQAGEAVLKGLLKAQELDDALVDRGVEPQAALVGADGAVELDAEAAVDVNIALVILPGHTELDGALRLHQAVHHAFTDQLGTGVGNRGEGGEDLPHRLVKFRLGGIALDDPLHQTVQILILNAHDCFLPKDYLSKPALTPLLIGTYSPYHVHFCKSMFCFLHFAFLF